MCTGFSSACALAANGRLVASAAVRAGARNCLLAVGMGFLLFFDLFLGPRRSGAGREQGTGAGHLHVQQHLGVALAERVGAQAARATAAECTLKKEVEGA